MIIAAIVVTVIAIIYFAGRKAGKNASNNPWQAPLPKDDAHSTGSSPVDSAKVRTIADDLYADLDKWDWNPFTFTRDVEVYKRFNSLSDTEFVAVYNDWNFRFSSEFSGKSLPAVIKDELGWGLGQFNSIRDSIILRCERLKLV
jgi:hypothetical protein